MAKKEKEPKKYHFTILPYLNMRNIEEVDLGFAKVWNFELRKDKYLKNSKLREQVGKMISCYKTSHPFGMREELLTPVYGIGVISTNDPFSKEPDTERRRCINDARLMLFISSVARNNTLTWNANTGHWMVSSENFSSSNFSVILNSELMSEALGFVSPSLHGGIDINKNVYLRGRHVPNSDFSYDERLLKALLDMRQKRPVLFRRLMVATEIFYEACYNSTEISHNARILLQASAFETLLNTKSGEGRKGLKDFLQEHAVYSDEKEVTYTYEVNGKKKTEKKNIRVKWADRFFTLRNHISHKNLPKEKDYYFGSRQRHFDIATFFFVFCIKRKVEQALRKELFGDDVMWETWVDDLRVTPEKFTGFKYMGVSRRGWERAETG